MQYLVTIRQPWSGWHDVINEYRSYDWKLEFDAETSEITLGEDRDFEFLSAELLLDLLAAVHLNTIDMSLGIHLRKDHRGQAG